MNQSASLICHEMSRNNFSKHLRLRHPKYFLTNFYFQLPRARGHAEGKVQSHSLDMLLICSLCLLLLLNSRDFDLNENLFDWLRLRGGHCLAPETDSLFYEVTENCHHSSHSCKIFCTRIHCHLHQLHGEHCLQQRPPGQFLTLVSWTSPLSRSRLSSPRQPGLAASHQLVRNHREDVPGHGQHPQPRCSLVNSSDHHIHHHHLWGMTRVTSQDKTSVSSSTLSAAMCSDTSWDTKLTLETDSWMMSDTDLSVLVAVCCGNINTDRSSWSQPGCSDHHLQHHHCHHHRLQSHAKISVSSVQSHRRHQHSHHCVLTVH